MLLEHTCHDLTAGIISPLSVCNTSLLINDCAYSGAVLYTSMKNHFYKMKRDIGMADYEKLVKQDFHTPSIEFHTPSLYLESSIPHPYIFVSFYNGAEQDAAQQSGFMEDSYIKKQRYTGL